MEAYSFKYKSQSSFGKGGGDDCVSVTTLLASQHRINDHFGRRLSRQEDQSNDMASKIADLQERLREVESKQDRSSEMESNNKKKKKKREAKVVSERTSSSGGKKKLLTVEKKKKVTNTVTNTSGRRVEKKKASRSVHKIGESSDFSEVTHKVTEGPHRGFMGSFLGGKNSKGNFRLLFNSRGKPVKEVSEIIVDESCLIGVDSNDMLAFVGVEGQEEEDDKLLEYEKTTWRCNKCNGVNGNDGSFCNNVVEGKVCSTIKPFDGKRLGWHGCFPVSIYRCCLYEKRSYPFMLTNFFSLLSTNSHMICPKQQQQNEGGTWICPLCRIRSDKDNDKCKACETPKP